MTNVFIDGSAGTTGLRIYDRLKQRSDIKLITLSEEMRKDINARRDALNSSDIAFLCLPDDAARESVSLVTNGKTAIIDTSTAHRTSNDWVYGFAEISNFRSKIATSKRIANPGCHASGFIALVEPLISAGLLQSDVELTSFSVTGYTGGGKKMIAEYEGEKPKLYEAPRQYGLNQNHKHLPEMQTICKLTKAPIFCPIVSDFDCGMEVTVPIFKNQLKGSINDVKSLYKSKYNTDLVKFVDSSNENGFLSASSMKGKDGMEISVFGNEERILLVSRFDNLGKGASGAAIQNMNIILGIDETTGLVI